MRSVSFRFISLKEMIFNSINIGKLLIVLSGALYLLGTVFLAASIRWQSEILREDDDSKFAKNVRRMGSPGHTDVFRFRIGMILSGLGYVLLLINTLVDP